VLRHLAPPTLAVTFACATPAGAPSGGASGAAPPTATAPRPGAPARPGQSKARAGLDEARKLAKANDLAGAKRAVDKVVSENPEDEEGYLLGASLASMLEEATETDRYLATGLAKIPKSGLLHHAKGMALLERGDAAGAVASLETARGLAPTNGDILADLAYAYVFVQRFADAKTTGAAARKLAPTSYAAAFAHGEALYRLDEHAAAIEAFEAASKLDPSERVPRARLAGCYMKTNTPAKAIPLLEGLTSDARATEPAERARMLAGLAQAYLAVSRAPDAVTTARAAVELQPKEPAYLGVLADAQEAAGDKAGAKATRAKLPKK
jgi:Flp pilus assembly protein TadD